MGLDATKYQEYFEVFDQSDKLTQELVIYNNLSATPVDSISGTFKYVDVKIAFEYLKAGTTDKILIQSSCSWRPRHHREAVQVWKY